MGLGAWGFRGTPTQGAAMPMADVEADGKGPLVVSLWALGAGDTDCLLLSGRLPLEVEGDRHPPPCVRTWLKQI